MTKTIANSKSAAGIKHDTLTKDEVKSYVVDSRILDALNLCQKNNPGLKRSDIRILDWGCGRGRAVLKLLEMGYSVYGIDIDRATIENGFPLFRNCGYDPGEHLRHMNDIHQFTDGFFQFVFSEQVFEHVENLELTIRSHARLTAKGGIGCHVFPSSKMVRESHLNMPFVHWFPKNISRKVWINLMMLFSKKPDVTWPETVGKSFWGEVNVYYDYLNNKTFYRDNNAIKRLFNTHGFEADFIIPGTNTRRRKIIPGFLLFNGFPDQQVCFIVKKM